ncbi:DUF4179 domain-containing protein [Paenibacillus shenyangensis]|uniref:DUF4179 domain-containing protein n=1 Tax=Paenibacillus sp. A9 TaxID=1284352 RepID=UPI0003658A94|nr:DUF4179 domain-containing protein [Paenibacillus sp. A9]
MNHPRHDKLSNRELEELEASIQSEITSSEQEWKTSLSFERIWSEYHTSNSKKEARYAKLRNRPKWQIAILCTLILGVGVLFTAALFPSIGEALRSISFVNRLYQSGLTNPEYQRIEQKQLADSLNDSVTDQGISLTVNDVFYDGVNILISYEVIDKEGKQRIKGSNPGPWLDYDFHGANRNGAMTEPTNTLIDSNHLEGVAIISFIDDSLPDKMNVTLFCERITDVRGDWKLTIPISLQKSKPYTQTMYPDLPFTMNGRTLKVKKLILGPVSNQITITGDSLSSYWEPMIQVMDDQGHVLAPAGGGGSSGEIIRGFDPFTLQNPHPKYIKIIFNDPPKIASDGTSDAISPKRKSTTIKIPLHWEQKGQLVAEQKQKDR